MLSDEKLSLLKVHINDSYDEKSSGKGIKISSPSQINVSSKLYSEVFKGVVVKIKSSRCYYHNHINKVNKFLHLIFQVIH